MYSFLLRPVPMALLGCLFSLYTQSQTIRTIGPVSDFSTLKEAFDAVNNGLITGSLEFHIEGSTQESASAVLNASGTGTSNYSSIVIYPTNPGIQISGNFPGALIDFSGASNITIDGRVNKSGSSPDLIIENTEYLNSGAKTIRFINSANNINITFCEIRGGTPSTSSGIIFFSTAGSGAGNQQTHPIHSALYAKPLPLRLLQLRECTASIPREQLTL